MILGWKGHRLLYAIIAVIILFGNLSMRAYSHECKNGEFSGYMNELKEKIQKNWNPPDNIEEGKVTVVFEIDKDGNLVFSEIKSSSGNLLYDESITNALKKSSPFSKLPENSSRNSLTIQYSFESSLVKTDSIKEIVKKAEQFYNIDNKMALVYINQAINEVKGDCASYFLYAKRSKINKAMGNIQAAESDMTECKRLKNLYDKKRIDRCQKAVATVNDAFSYFYLANAYDIAGDYNNAINAIDKAIAMTPLNHAYKRYKLEMIEKYKK